jgi:hypothetical protein
MIANGVQSFHAAVWRTRISQRKIHKAHRNGTPTWQVRRRVMVGSLVGLSPESAEFLEMMRKRRHDCSVSSIFEAILHAVRRKYGKAALERAIADYYSSLSPREVEEQRNWSEFAMRQFPIENA